MKNMKRVYRIFLLVCAISAALLLPEKAEATPDYYGLGTGDTAYVQNGSKGWVGPFARTEIYDSFYLTIIVKGDAPISQIECETNIDAVWNKNVRKFTFRLPDKSKWKYDSARNTWTLRISFTKNLTYYTSFNFSGNISGKQEVYVSLAPKTSRTVKGFGVSKMSSGTKIYWTNQSDFQYKMQIMRSTSKNGEFSEIASVDTAKKNSYTDTSAKGTITYYYKIRYYDERYSGWGNIIQTAFSDIKSNDQTRIFTGWKTVNSAKYYYVNGKKSTGWKKISGKYYYFNSSGVLQKNKIVGSKSKGYYYVDKNGVRSTDAQIQAAVKFVMANSSSGQTSDKRLKSCFKALCKYPYYRIYNDKPSASKIKGFANYMFKNKKGNCYRYASAMAYIARVLGYDSRVSVGGVASRSSATGLSAHGWCEIKSGGKWKMIDCSMQRAYTSKNLFCVTRDKYPFRLKCNKTYTMTVTNGVVTWK